MPASLSFKQQDKVTDVANLGEVKIITLEDTGGSIYTLDITTSDLKVAYTPQGGQKVEKTITGLATALGKLLTIDGSTPGKSVLAEEVAKQPVVDVLVPALATVGTDDTKKVYTKSAADTKLNSKVNITGDNATDPGVTTMLSKLTGANVVAKIDGSNATEAGVNAMLATLKGDNVVVKVPDLITKVNVLGDNATEAGVNAMLGKLKGDNVVVKVPDLITKVNVLGDNATEAGVNAMLGKLKGDNVVVKVPDLTTKVNVLGDNATEAGVKAMLDKLTDKVVKTLELKTKAAEKEVVNAITASSDFTDKVYTKTAADTAFVKATELKTKAAAKDVVDAITASSDFTNKVYIKADQADEVYTKTAADTAFVKATELKTKVAEKAVVDSITASSDFTGKVYTKTAADTAFVKATELKTKAAAKDVVDAITASSDFTGKVYTKTAADTAFVKATELKTKAAEKEVVNAITASSDFTDKVYTKTAADTAFAKINASNLTEAANKKAFAEAILPAQDGDKSILVDKLGGFLDNSTDNKYGVNSDQTAKAFLAAKGMTPTAAQPALQTHVAQIRSSPEFKRAVQEEMSQPYFEPPTSDDAALNLIW